MLQSLAAICIFLVDPLLCLSHQRAHLLSRGKRKSAIAGGGAHFPENRWDTNRPITFFFDESVSEETRQIIRAAAEFWQNNTCINFQENGQMQLPRVRFYRGNGCFSRKECPFGSAISKCVHWGQLRLLRAGGTRKGHVLGMIHTHVRTDRDQFIAIQRENVPKGMEKDFERISPDNATNLGVEYDYGSVMRYTRYNQQNGKVIMEAKQPLYQHTMGNTYGSIFSDLLEVNRFLGCGRICLDVQSKRCQNGGFPNPKRCTECICPNGFGGMDCAQRVQGEGGAICGRQANAQWQTLQGAVEAETSGQMRSAGCHFHVTAPPGHRIEIRVEDLSGLCSPECNVGAFELKFERMASSGARMCCNSHISEMGVIRSEGPLAVASIYSQKAKRSFVLSHRTVSPSAEVPPYAKWSASPPPGNRQKCLLRDRRRSKPRAMFRLVAECASNKNGCTMIEHSANMAKLCRKTCDLCIGAPTFAGYNSTTPPKGTKDENCADLAQGCAKINYLCGLGTRAHGMAILCEKTCGCKRPPAD